MIKNKNILTDGKDIAQALNFGKYKVLKYNLDENKGSTAKVEKQTTRYGIQHHVGTLYRGKQTADDGIFYLINSTTMLTAGKSVQDYIKWADDANAPVIYEGDEVAILVYSESLGHVSVQLVKALKPTPEYSTSLVFEDLY